VYNWDVKRRMEGVLKKDEPRDVAGIES
jgi:hypothetical protein